MDPSNSRGLGARWCRLAAAQRLGARAHHRGQRPFCTFGHFGMPPLFFEEPLLPLRALAEKTVQVPAQWSLRRRALAPPRRRRHRAQPPQPHRRPPWPRRRQRRPQKPVWHKASHAQDASTLRGMTFLTRRGPTAKPARPPSATLHPPASPAPPARGPVPLLPSLGLQNPPNHPGLRIRASRPPPPVSHTSSP